MLNYKYIPYLNVIYYCRQYNRSLFWNTLPLPKAYSKLSAAYRDVSYILSWWGGVQNSERSVLVQERKAYAKLEDGHEECRMIVEAVTMEPSRPGPTYSDYPVMIFWSNMSPPRKGAWLIEPSRAETTTQRPYTCVNISCTSWANVTLNVWYRATILTWRRKYCTTKSNSHNCRACKFPFLVIFPNSNHLNIGTSRLYTFTSFPTPMINSSSSCWIVLLSLDHIILHYLLLWLKPSSFVLRSYKKEIVFPFVPFMKTSCDDPDAWHPTQNALKGIPQTPWGVVSRARHYSHIV